MIIILVLLVLLVLIDNCDALIVSKLGNLKITSPYPSINRNIYVPSSSSSIQLLKHQLSLNAKEDDVITDEKKEPSAFDQVASKGLAGVLAIALAEAIFWALGMPLATLWVKFTTGEWIDLMTTEGQLQAAGFTFGYGGFATVILQYR